MAKKIFTVKMTKESSWSSVSTRPARTYEQTGTIDELVESYSYTLECGASWAHEKGNSKINRNPRTIKTLIKNLNNAVNNSAANGYAGETYSLVEA